MNSRITQAAVIFLALLSASIADQPEPGPAGTAGASRPPELPGMVFVEGGTFQNRKSGYYEKKVAVSSFYIGKHEVTQTEWLEVMGDNPSHFSGPDLPVEMVSWYDCVEYCNKRSAKEGLKPYYNINKTVKDPNNHLDREFGVDFDTEKWTVTTKPGADGYRLPTEAEWEYAAGGGRKSRSFIYSGGDDLDKVAWYYQNSGDKPLPAKWHRQFLEGNHDRTHPVGGKEANELGIHDMSGNVREWCWDWFGDLALQMGEADPKGGSSGSFRVWRGGCWMSSDFTCAASFRGSNNPSNYRANDQGLRVCRDK